MTLAPRWLDRLSQANPFRHIVDAARAAFRDDLGDSSLVVGEMLRAHVDDAVLTEGHVDVAKLHPLGRLGGDGYLPLREVLHLARPKVERE